ncbi:MAG: ATP-dependent RNA helicase ddx24, partial [Marteilia pararefringens]
GTGKTMAFSIPLLNRIILTNQEEGPPAKKPCKTPLEISNQSSLKDEEGFIDLNTLMGDHLSTQKYLKIQALIISPSRELCIQIKKHIESVVSNQNITVLSLTGGLNHAKQHNLLEKEPNIVVGTPGRILDFTNLDPRFANSLKHLQTLVFDEADKLFDPKSFSEIKSILNLLRCKKSDEDSGYVQIYMVSATLYSIYGTQDANTQKYLKHFMKKLKLNHNKIHHINLIDDCALPSKLEEFKIFCLNPDKDLYLLYLLQKLESKFCMIFVNSKDKVKILTEKLELCGYKNRVFGLSSELNQRQRFESLKRFSDLDDSKKDVPKILITTDLSSRGFDIESISCII